MLRYIFVTFIGFAICFPRPGGGIYLKLTASVATEVSLVSIRLLSSSTSDFYNKVLHKLNPSIAYTRVATSWYFQEGQNDCKLLLQPT